MSHQSAGTLELVTFTADTTNIVGPIVNWDFGDGIHCEQCGLTESHRYQRPGTYPVRLTATEPICGGAQVSFPQYLVVGRPPMHDDAQMVEFQAPECVTPQHGVSARITLRNVGGTTWSSTFGQKLSMIAGADRFSPATVPLPAQGAIPPNGEVTLDFNLGAIGTELGSFTAAFQMTNLFDSPFGETRYHLVRVADSCDLSQPKAGDYTCTVTVATPEGRPIQGVETRLTGRRFEDLRDPAAEVFDRAVTDARGIAYLALDRVPGAPFQTVRCAAPNFVANEPNSKTESHPIEVPIGTHIDLNLTASSTDQRSQRLVAGGLKPGNAVARLYQSGAYDKVIVIPAPFTGDEQQDGGGWTHDKLFRRFETFMVAASKFDYDIWLITTTTGQNIHEQAAETAQIIDAAAKRLGPDGTINVLGYSLGGIGARLTTARYQADPDWRIRLGVRPNLPVRTIGFGDAPLLGANVPRGLQDLIWTNATIGDFGKGFAEANLNSCGAQQLLLDSYPTGAGNHEKFWLTGSELRFPDRGKLAAGRGGVCDRVEGNECICEADSPVLSINGDGWAHGIPLYSFSDGYNGPNECYGDQKDVPFGANGRPACALENLASKLCTVPPGEPFPPSWCPYPSAFTYPFAPPTTFPFPMFSWSAPLSGGVLYPNPSLDLAPGSRHSILEKTKFGFGITTQFYSPTFIPLWSALPAGAPFADTHTNDFQAIHGVGVESNIEWILTRLEQHNGPATAFASSARPADAGSGLTPVEVSYPQDLSPGGVTTLELTTSGPPAPPMYVPLASNVYYNITSTVDSAATAMNPIQICVDYGDTAVMDASRLGLFHYSGSNWSDITSSRDADNHRVCGNTTSFSPFALFEPINLPPVAVAGSGIRVEAAGPGGARVILSAAGSYDPDGDEVQYQWLDASGVSLAEGGVVEVLFPTGDHQLTLRMTDSRGRSSYALKRVEVVDTAPPSISLKVDPAPAGAYLLSAEASDAVGVTRVRFEVDGQVVGEVLSAPYTLSWSPGDVADGSHEIRAFALDAAGNVGQAPGVVVLIDRTAPSLNAAASPSVVWPPNGKLVPIAVSVSVFDILDPNPRVFLESVVCDDGCDPAADVVGANLETDDRTFFVRARRQGGGAGRTYAITYRAVDASGNVTRRTITVLVPHDRR